MQAACALPPELTIYTAGELHPLFLAWMAADTAAPADDDGLQVEADAVREVDAAGVQLLLSLANALADRQRQLQLLRPSAPLAAACAALGAQCLVAATRSTGPAR